MREQRIRRFKMAGTERPAQREMIPGPAIRPGGAEEPHDIGAAIGGGVAECLIIGGMDIGACGQKDLNGLPVAVG